MSRYDGLIIPRSYSEYINKTDAATLQQALQLPGVLSGAVADGDNKAVKSSAVNSILKNKSYGEDIEHTNGQYAKLTITVTKPYSTTIIALMERGASMDLIGVCANDSGNADVRAYLKDIGIYGHANFYYKPISIDKVEFYWNVNGYSTLSNYQIITNAAYTELTTDNVDSLPDGVIQL